MTTTLQQNRKRFKSLPPMLQDTLFSVQTAEAVKRICDQNHIPSEKIGAIAESVGLVLLGFIHSEELASEIEQRTALAPQMAKELASALNSRIFSSIKPDLEKIYAPVEEEPAPLPSSIPTSTTPAAPPPKIIEEIKKPPVPYPSTGSTSSPQAIPAPST